MKYTILKGCHYSNFIPKLGLNKDIDLSYNITFNESCLYKIQEKSCVNKLFGLCYGLFGVHKNSIRFGWASDNNKILIYAYIWWNGKLSKYPLIKVNPNENHTYKIHIKKNCFCSFSIDGKEKEVIILSKVNNPFIWTLGFYFGGNSTAPHKMFIEMF